MMSNEDEQFWDEPIPDDVPNVTREFLNSLLDVEELTLRIRPCKEVIVPTWLIAFKVKEEILIKYVEGETMVSVQGKIPVYYEQGENATRVGEVEVIDWVAMHKTDTSTKLTHYVGLHCTDLPDDRFGMLPEYDLCMCLKIEGSTYIPTTLIVKQDE